MVVDFILKLECQRLRLSLFKIRKAYTKFDRIVI